LSLPVNLLLVAYALLIFLFAGYEKITLVGFPSLPNDHPATFPSHTPLVSVILPVRNQASTLEGCLGSLTSLDYQNKEIIVVDGGSTDGTPQILAKFQHKIRIINEEPLPKGWVGKNWACHLGYGQAEGEIFLFTDGDSVHATDSLSRTVAYLQSLQVDLVTLAPQTILRTFWEKLLQPPVFYLIMLSVGGKWVNDDRRRNNSIGNGQYMLITRTAYEKIGGHEAVHDRIVEDLSMARNLKRAGLRLRFLVAQDAFGVRMYSSLREIWVGWRKNFYTVSENHRFPRAILRFLFLFIFFILPFIILAQGILLAGLQPLNLFLLSGGFMCFWLWLGMLIFYKQGARLNPAYGLLFPLAVAIYMGIGVDSTIRGALGKGLSWKGRVYGQNNQKPDDTIGRS
jgi:chlorobactene glucosyltransferase